MFGASRDPRLSGGVPRDPRLSSVLPRLPEYIPIEPITHYPLSPEYKPDEQKDIKKVDVSINNSLITKHRFEEVNADREQIKKSLEEINTNYKNLKKEADKLYYRKEEFKATITKKDELIKELETRIKELENSNLSLSVLPAFPAFPEPHAQYQQYNRQPISMPPPPPPISMPPIRMLPPPRPIRMLPPPPRPIRMLPHEQQYIHPSYEQTIPHSYRLNYHSDGPHNMVDYYPEINYYESKGKRNRPEIPPYYNPIDCNIATILCFHVDHKYNEKCKYAHSISDLKICDKPFCNRRYCTCMLHSEEDRNILYKLANKCGATNGNERICKRYLNTGGQKCDGECKCIHWLYEQSIKEQMN